MAAPKVEKTRPAKLTDEELEHMLHQVVLKASLHNRNITVDEIKESTDKLVKLVRIFSEKK